VKSLTQPLPSVLPKIATKSRAASTPSSISLVTPDASPGWRIGTRQTTHSILVAPWIGTARVSLAGIRPRLTGEAAVNGGASGRAGWRFNAPVSA
jgi:hypothetical protein